MLAFADALRTGGAGLRVLNMDGGDVDTSTPMGSMLFTVMAALAQMEHEIKRERVTDSISKRRQAGLDLGAGPGGSRTVRSAARCAWSKGAHLLRKLLRTSECPAQRSTDAPAHSRCRAERLALRACASTGAHSARRPRPHD